MTAPSAQTVSAAQTAGTARVALRDGSTAGVRLTSSGDGELMRAFFDRLSPQSLRLRFLGVTHVDDALMARLCDSSDLDQAATLVVCRHHGDGPRFVGVGSYFSGSSDGHIAEVAFAVDDGFHGHGIGTALLERLVPLAVDHGFASFQATVLAENGEMLGVFRDSRFEQSSSFEEGCVEAVRAPARSSSARRQSGGTCR